MNSDDFESLKRATEQVEEIRQQSHRTLKLTEFDAAKYLRDPEGLDNLLADALESGDERYIVAARAIVSRVRGS
jgi:DNA-binding phage protein